MKSKSLVFASAVALTVFAGGCASSSSTSYKKAGDASTSIQKTAVGIDKGEVQIDAVLLALSDLVNHPNTDLKAQFEKFNTSVDKLDSLSKDVSKQAVAMQAQGAAYFQQWNTDLDTMQNEDIRSRSTERKNLVAARFDRVRASYAQAKNAFVPFMSRLTDVRTALATDLTTEGLASVKSVANEAKTDATPLREALRDLSTEFKALGVSLSTAGQ